MYLHMTIFEHCGPPYRSAMWLTALFHTACLSTPAFSAAQSGAQTIPHFNLVLCLATTRKTAEKAETLFHGRPLLWLSPCHSRNIGFHKGEADVCDSCCLCVFVWMPDVCCSFNCLLSPPGRSSLFPIDDNLLDDGHGNQGVPGVLGSPNCYPHQNGERIERFSRKVFVGGLPPDIDEGEDSPSHSGLHFAAGLLLFCQASVCFLHLCCFPQMK